MFVRRSYFNEEPFLRKLLEVRLLSSVLHSSLAAQAWYESVTKRSDVHLSVTLSGPHQRRNVEEKNCVQALCYPLIKTVCAAHAAERLHGGNVAS